MADELNLSNLTKLVTGMAALAYGTGVVAINTYLHELGIADFSFAKPKLLLTGILTLISLLLLASHLFFLAWSLASQHGPVNRELPPLKWVVLWALLFLLLLVGASAVLCFQSDAGLGQLTVRHARETLAGASHLFRLRTTLRVAAEVYTPVLLGAVFVYIATRVYDRTRQKANPFHCRMEQFYCLIALAAIGAAIVGYVYMFTRTFYPAIPQEFGGGKPYFESLAVEDSEHCNLQQIGIPFDKDRPRITRPLPVLHETDTLLAVWLRCPAKKDCNDGEPVSREDRYVVVQIGKGAFSSTRAYASGAGEATLVPYAGPCKIDDTPSPAPANPSGAESKVTE